MPPIAPKYGKETVDILVENLNDHMDGYVTGRKEQQHGCPIFQDKRSLIGKIISVVLDEAKGFYYMGTYGRKWGIVLALSPMMTQYLETKKENPDCLLFYPFGRFSWNVFEDAKIVSQELESDFDRKRLWSWERAPMCGVPYHAVEGYLTSWVSRAIKWPLLSKWRPKTCQGISKARGCSHCHAREPSQVRVP